MPRRSASSILYLEGRICSRRECKMPCKVGLLLRRWAVAVLWGGAAILGAMFASSRADAALIFGVTFDNQLFSFNSTAPGNILSGTPITGLQSNEVVQAIDVRPSTDPTKKLLYALGSSSRIYTINVSTGAATLVTGPISPLLNGTAFGMDFNPVADRMRIHSDIQQNLRVQVDAPFTVTTDPNLAYQ